MDYIISITGPAKETAIARALNAYNQRNPLLTDQQFVEKLVEGQIGALVQAYVTLTVTRLAFIERFTMEERTAIRAAAQSDAAIEDYLQMLSVSEEVNLTHELTVSGVQALEAAGLIAQGRAAEILAL